MSLATGDWSQWTFAPRMTTEYDISPYRYFGLIPCSGTVFIDWDSDSLFRFGGTKDDLGDTAVQALWKSLEMYQTGEMGKITEFKTWKQSNNANGLDFDVYDNLDTGIVATKRDSLGYRVRRRDITCPESESFKIEIKTYADSLAVDRIDVKYSPTGPMPVD